ncbi:MAG: immunogenic protein precursor [Betaproteobacteria bacterium]|nr:immunogenic protein precursor [Betaproteobacteria bacterium]
MSNAGRRSFLHSAAGVALAGLGPRVRAQQKTNVVLATATPGGGFPVYGAAYMAAINQADPTLEVQTRNTRGSDENIPGLEQGKFDLGLVQGESAHEAFAGIGRAPLQLKIVVGIYSSPGMFVVRADSPYHRIADLKGQAVAFGAAGSGLVILARYVLDGIGLKQDTDFKAVYLERAGDGPPMVKDGRVAALWGGGSGWPGFTNMMADPAGARLIAPSEDEIRGIRAKYDFLKRLTIPAGSYPKQPQEIVSVGSWSFILARTDFPDDTAYRLTRALHKAQDALGKSLPQARESRVENICGAAPRPDMIHPGTLRYLKEIGAAP